MIRPLANLLDRQSSSGDLLPELDGILGLAVLIVMASHAYVFGTVTGPSGPAAPEDQALSDQMQGTGLASLARAIRTVTARLSGAGRSDEAGYELRRRVCGRARLPT